MTQSGSCCWEPDSLPFAVKVLVGIPAVLPVMLSTMLLPEMEQEQGRLQDQLKQHQLAADPAAAQVMIGGVWVRAE